MTAELWVGQLVNDRYDVLDRVGQGAMGAVYRATDTRTGQTVALKVLNPDLALDPEITERFRREAEALWRLRHPNIVGFVELFTYRRQHIIAMEYVPGGSLHALLRRQGTLPPDRARQIALGLALALDQAHQAGIIHRDLKPENVLIDPNGQPRLTDFGVARLLNRNTRLTSTGGEAIGTPFYIAPEVWEGKAADPQTDIWALGVMLFEMLSGRLPFAGKTPAAIITSVLMAPPPDLRALSPGAPEGLVRIVSRMLTRDRTQRYATMREVAADLQRGAPAEPVIRPAAPPRPPTLTPPRPVARPAVPTRPSTLNTAARYGSLVVFGLAVVAVLTVLALGSGHLPSPPTPPPPTVAAARPISLANAARVHFQKIFSSSSAAVLSLAYSPDGVLLAAVRGDKSLRVWEAASGRLAHTFSSNANCINCLAFSPDGQTLVTLRQEKADNLVAWNVVTAQKGWETALSPAQPDAELTSLAFSPQGQMVAWGSTDATAALWSVPDQRLLFTLPGHTAAVQSVSFSPDGRQLVTASNDWTLIIWDVASGAAVRTLTGHTGEVVLALFSPDGRRIASGGYDKSVCVWDAASGQQTWTGQVHTETVTALAFSPDGQVLASGSVDKTIVLWEAATGRQLNRLTEHTAPVTTLAFSPGGETLASGSQDGTLRLWEAAP